MTWEMVQVSVSLVLTMFISTAGVGLIIYIALLLRDRNLRKEEAMKFPKKLYTKIQRKWCENYQSVTGFEPLMDDYEAGNRTFQQAANLSVWWFEDWSNDAFLKCDFNHLSIDMSED